jgi:hypothetical protein
VKLYNLNAENMGACTFEFDDAQTIIRHKVRNITVFKISRQIKCMQSYGFYHKDYDTSK